MSEQQILFAPVVHQTRISHSGHEFCPSANIWKLSKDSRLHLTKIINLLDEPLRDSFRNVMIFYACNHSDGTCRSVLYHLTTYLQKTGDRTFKTLSLRNYKAQTKKQDEHTLVSLRVFLKLWHQQGYPGVSDEVAELVDSWTLKRAVKGAAVKSLDPVKGPLTDVELQTFNDAVPQAYEHKKISLSTLAYALLLSHTGLRPIQMTLMRIGDIYSGATPKGGSAYKIRFPRAKQRGVAAGSELNSFDITANLHRVLHAQANSVIQRVSSHINGFPKTLIPQLPLFPSWHQITRIDDVVTLAGRLQNESLCARKDSMHRALNRIHIVSPRTGERMKINAIRFRYTQGTRAARAGFGVYVIAALLDHTTTESAAVYTRDHPNFRFKVDAAVGQELAPMAQAFAGTLVNDASAANNGSDVTKRVRNAKNTLGVCGNQAFCGLNPVVCYTCVNFQPFLNAPHKNVLDGLIADRQRVLAITQDEDVANSNDSSILAVRRVMALCEQRRAELAGGADA